MDINEDILNAAAITFELGIPLLLILLCRIAPGKKKLWIPMLGAVTPAVLFFAYVTFGYYFISREEFGFSFGFGAMWIMGFFIYCLFLLAGFSVGLVLQARLNLYWSYGLAFFIGPLCGWGFIVIESIA